MPRPSQNLEAHILFCPPDPEAQIQAGQYIADIKPSVVWLGTRANTLSTDIDLLQTQGFYDTVTGYDNPNSLGKMIDSPIPGGKVYDSAFAFHADLVGRDKATFSLLDFLEEAGANLEIQIPYYSTVMQLQDTGIPFLATNTVKYPEVTEGGQSPVFKAALDVNLVEDHLFVLPNGISQLEEAIRVYRQLMREEASLMMRGTTRMIKRLPNMLKDGEKAVILTDQIGIYDIRKQQPSKKVETVVKSFTSAKVAQVRGSKRVLPKFEYPGLLGPIETGVEFDKATEARLGIPERVIAHSIIDKIFDYCGVTSGTEHREMADEISIVAVAHSGNKEKANELLDGVKSIAKRINVRERERLASGETDEELLGIERAASTRDLVEHLKAMIIKNSGLNQSS